MAGDKGSSGAKKGGGGNRSRRNSLEKKVEKQRVEEEMETLRTVVKRTGEEAGFSGGEVESKKNREKSDSEISDGIDEEVEDMGEVIEDSTQEDAEGGFQEVKSPRTLRREKDEARKSRSRRNSEEVEVVQERRRKFAIKILGDKLTLVKAIRVLKEGGLDFKADYIVWSNSDLNLSIPTHEKRILGVLERKEVTVTVDGEKVTMRFVELTRPPLYWKLMRRVPLAVQMSDIVELFGGEEVCVFARRAKMFSAREGKPVESNIVELKLTQDINAICLLGREFDVEDRVKPPIQCYRCQKWGHVAASCRSFSEVCRICAQGHNARNCPIKDKTGVAWTPKCANCDKSHCASFIGCEERRKFLEKRDGGVQIVNPFGVQVPVVQSDSNSAQSQGGSVKETRGPGAAVSYSSAVSGEVRQAGAQGGDSNLGTDMQLTMREYKNATSTERKLDCMFEMVMNLCVSVVGLQKEIVHLRKQELKKGDSNNADD